LFELGADTKAQNLLNLTAAKQCAMNVYDTKLSMYPTGRDAEMAKVMRLRDVARMEIADWLVDKAGEGSIVWDWGPSLTGDEYREAREWYRERKQKAQRFLGGDWSQDTGNPPVEHRLLKRFSAVAKVNQEGGTTGVSYSNIKLDSASRRMVVGLVGGEACDVTAAIGAILKRLSDRGCIAREDDGRAVHDLQSPKDLDVRMVLTR